MGEPLLTKFYIFEPDDPETMLVWNYMGEILSSNRDTAASKFYAGRAEPVFYVVVTENAWKVRKRTPKVVTQATTVDVKMPEPDELPVETPPAVRQPDSQVGSGVGGPKPQNAEVEEPAVP